MFVALLQQGRCRSVVLKSQLNVPKMCIAVIVAIVQSYPAEGK